MDYINEIEKEYEKQVIRAERYIKEKTFKKSDMEQRIQFFTQVKNEIIKAIEEKNLFLYDEIDVPEYSGMFTNALIDIYFGFCKENGIDYFEKIKKMFEDD